MELEEHGNVAISQENYGVEGQEILCNELFRFEDIRHSFSTPSVNID